MKNSIVFTRLPIPPSSNHQYSSFMRHGRVVHVPARELVEFKKSYKAWTIVNHDLLMEAHKLIKDWKLLDVCIFLCINSYTQAGTVRKMDVSNRIKALHDCLSDSLEKDDSLFFKVHASKVHVGIKSDEQCIVVIKSCEPDMQDEILKLKSSII